MRTGAEYKESLRDGRDVWVMGEGAVADVTTHRATSAMVNEYVRWYDRHFEADWRDILMAPPDGEGQRRPLAFVPPKTSGDLVRLGKAISAVHALGGGNMTHNPGYGALIALGMVNVLKELNNSAEEIETAEEYLESLAESGRFLTFAGAGTLIGTRMRRAEEERAAIRLVRETAEGIVVSGKLQMHTSTPFAEELLVTCRDELPLHNGRFQWFIVPVNSPGLRVVARRVATRHENPFLGPLSSRFDELDAMVWMEEVFVPRSRVFAAEPLDGEPVETAVAGIVAAVAPQLWVAGQGGTELGSGAGLDGGHGVEGQSADDGAVGGDDGERADDAHLHDGSGTGPGDDGGRACAAQPTASGGCGDQYAEGPAANDGNPAGTPRFVAGQCPGGH